MTLKIALLAALVWVLPAIVPTIRTSHAYQTASGIATWSIFTWIPVALLISQVSTFEMAASVGVVLVAAAVGRE